MQKFKIFHFSQIPETSKLPLPIVPRRPHPRVNLTQKDLGERVLVFGEKRGILRYIGKFKKKLKAKSS